MNPSIKKLAELADKKSRKIIGLMSGTSLDGLDIALCNVTGFGERTSVKMHKFATVPYATKDRQNLKKITSVENVKLKEISYWHTRLAHLHAHMILNALDRWGVKADEIDCIASHGQTIYHYPARDQMKEAVPSNNTLQIGDGDQIAVKTGILTLSDFRQKHVACGGEGAPMAGLVDELLFSHSKETRILLNIGGIGNYTFLTPTGSKTRSFTTDTGPGNTLIDALALYYFEKPFDKDAEIAFGGTVHKELLEKMLTDPWFDEKGSKTTGPEYFNLEWLRKKMDHIDHAEEEIPPEDLVRTAAEFTAATISKNIRKSLSKKSMSHLYVSGGGAHNPYVMKRLKEELSDIEIKDIEELGITADAKEAVIFAVLANEMVAGKGFRFVVNGKSRKVNFGKISFPE